MNRRSLIRKGIYFGLIAALLVPLSLLSQPATRQLPGRPGSSGGTLAQLRAEHKLALADLGEIDPAGETMKLATLGLRGLAANLLWEKANQAKMKEDWSTFRAVLDQLTKVEPHFVAVWRYQAWNVSYNISVEWDDYRDRYFWVKEGVKFLEQGTAYNENEPRLVYDEGWVTAHKIGTADERVQYRQLFHDDDDPIFPAHEQHHRTMSQRDNWLVGQEYFVKAVHMVQERGAQLKTVNPLVFFSEPGMCQIDYSTALEEDGVFEEKARVAWEEAMRVWEEYGRHEFSSYEGFAFRLNEAESLKDKLNEKVKELDGLEPGLRKRLEDEKRAQLSQPERDALAIAPEARSQAESIAAFEAAQKTVVTHRALAKHVEGDKGARAVEIADELERLQAHIDAVDRSREIVNFPYWRMRCEVEADPDALEARRLFYQARQHFIDTEITKSREAYEQAFRHWRSVLDQFPAMLNDQVGGESMEQVFMGYMEVLKQLDEPYPGEDFILNDLFQNMRNRVGMSNAPPGA